MGIFNVRSAAIVGASQNRKKAGNIILRRFKSIFKGNLYAINPKYTSVEGVPCYSSLRELNYVDLVVVATPAKTVPSIIKDAVDIGAKLVIIISSGFSEIGENGKKLEEEILKIIKNSNTRVIGPNGLGVYDPYNGIDTFFIEETRVPRPGKGNIAIISQSGAIALALMEWLAYKGIGVSKIISFGNKIDVDEIDLLNEFINDKETRHIFMYIEGLKKGRGKEFIKLAREFIKKKGIIVALKAGKTKRGAIAVSSHTASLAGDYEIYKNVFRQIGIIEAKSMEDLLIYLQTISYYGI